MIWLFVKCDLFMEFAWEFHYLNNTRMSQIICICLLQIATFMSLQLFSYFLLCPLTVVNTDITWWTTFTAIVISSQISTCPMDLFFSSAPDGKVWPQLKDLMDEEQGELNKTKMQTKIHAKMTGTENNSHNRKLGLNFWHNRSPSIIIFIVLRC